MIYFIYSKKTEDDELLLERIKYYTPTNIDIQEARIVEGQLRTLDERLIRNMPFMLADKERPIYLTNDALDYFDKIKIMIKELNGTDNSKGYSFFINQMQTEQKLIIGRQKIIKFIDNLGKNYFHN